MHCLFSTLWHLYKYIYAPYVMRDGATQVLHASYIVHKKVKKKADSQSIPLAAPPSKPKAMGAKGPQQGAKAQVKVGRHTICRPIIRLHLSAAHSCMHRRGHRASCDVQDDAKGAQGRQLLNSIVLYQNAAYNGNNFRLLDEIGES